MVHRHPCKSQSKGKQGAICKKMIDISARYRIKFNLSNESISVNLKKTSSLATGSLLLLAGTAFSEVPSSNYLWFDKPAPLQGIVKNDGNYFGDASNFKGNSWESQALPIGNGRIGAMIFGGVERECLSMNEISLWSGGENPGGGYGYGPTADRNQFGSYQPFADALIDFDYKGGNEDPAEYTRSLSLEDAVAKVSFKKSGVTYTREYFSSFPDQVMVMTCTASTPGALNAAFTLKPNHTTTVTASGNTLILSGTLANGEKFEGRMVVITQGGKVTANGSGGKVDLTYENRGDGRAPVLDMAKLPSLKLSDATSCTVIISLATDYVMDYKKHWKGESPDKKNTAILARATKKTAEDLKKAHIANYKSLFDRCRINLGKTDPGIAKLPINERLKSYKSNPVDPELEETVFQMGRYMIISSSRPGTLPANLQGLWNNKVHQAWACDYHSNINVQMNYWGVEPTNLTECHLPLINYFKAMEEPSQIASQKEFKTQSGGKVRGWTVRTSQNIWGGHGWQWNIPGAAWYAHHIWNHYLFTGDKEYLKNTAYPMMKEIAMFWEDHLKELGKDGEGFKSNGNDVDIAELKGLPAGTLVAPNGWSPEHGPREDGVAHDQQLIWELFTNTITAANILNTDKSWAAELAKKRAKLAGPKIGKEGNLQEWMIDRIAKTQHRHTSHLYAVYPGSQISMAKTPDFAEAARKSLEWRGTTGDSRRSWSWTWRTALWARFHDGEKAHEMLAGLITHNMLDNLLTTHPPMQLDGTFGITGGIAEMLLQSQTGDVMLLPAPTKAWPDGSVRGMKARGDITVDFDWKNGKVTKYALRSPYPRPVKVVVNGQAKTVTPTQIAPAGSAKKKAE